MSADTLWELTKEMMKEEEEEFLKTFPTHHYKLPNSEAELWVFWSHENILQQQQQGFQINISYNDSFSAAVDTLIMMISDKIKHAFICANEDGYCEHSIIQFWAPVMTIHGRRLLSTSGQPFAVNHPSKNLSKYRLRCMEYQYSINDHYHDDDPMAMIISSDAPTSTAFLNRLPQLVSFKNLKRASSPLVDSALECGLRYSYMLPICFPFKTTSCCCIGVLELSITSTLAYDNLILMIKMMRIALEEVGLGVFQIQERIPYQIIHGPKPARDEIKQALKIVCESNNIDLAQVWIAFQGDNHMPFSSYSEATRKKQMLSLKLTGYLNEGSVLGFHYEEYYGLCDMFPLEIGENFVEKTLEDYKPRFCKDVSKLSGRTLVKKRLFNLFGGSRLAICLNSIHTGASCYAFEFIWGDNPDSDVKFVEKLLLKLKELFPSFKLASGEELSDELDIIKVGDSTATETEENLEASLSTLRRKCRKLETLKWKGRSKRKVNDLYSNQSNTNEEDTGTIQESLTVNRNEHTLTIKAEYAGDMIKFRLHIFQATFKNVTDEIGTRLKLTPGSYKVKYLDEDKDWILLTSEQDMRDCIKTSRDSDQTAVRLHVESST